MVMGGTRNLTVTNIHSFAKALKLNESETEFFETLVLFNQANEANEAKYYRQKLRRLSEKLPQKTSLITTEMLISKWYYPPIMIALEGRHRGKEVDEIANLLQLEKDLVEKIITFFAKKNIFYIKNDTYFLNEDYYIFYEKNRSRVQLKNFLREHLMRSLDALERQFHLNGKFFSHSMSISMENYNEYLGEIRNFLATITKRANEDGTDKVVQLNIQFFPLGE